VAEYFFVVTQNNYSLITPPIELNEITNSVLINEKVYLVALGFNVNFQIFNLVQSQSVNSNATYINIPITLLEMSLDKVPLIQRNLNFLVFPRVDKFLSNISIGISPCINQDNIHIIINGVLAQFQKFKRFFEEFEVHDLRSFWDQFGKSQFLSFVGKRILIISKMCELWKGGRILAVNRETTLNIINNYYPNKKAYIIRWGGWRNDNMILTVEFHHPGKKAIYFPISEDVLKKNNDIKQIIKTNVETNNENKDKWKEYEEVSFKDGKFSSELQSQNIENQRLDNDYRYDLDIKL